MINGVHALIFSRDAEGVLVCVCLYLICASVRSASEADAARHEHQRLSAQREQASQEQAPDNGTCYISCRTLPALRNPVAFNGFSKDTPT